MSPLPAIERFDSSTGVRIYRIHAEAFPNFIVYSYLVLEAGPPTLIDTGSGYGQSTEHLLAGLEATRTEFGESVGLKDIDRILITHGHIDHFGGLSRFVAETDAAVGIHVLDRRILAAYEERVVVATKAVRVYLQRAGVPETEQSWLMEMYAYSKKHVHSLCVDFLLDDGGELDGMRFLHTPGHCPGQVCIAIGNILLSADHILERISPHQAPESITPYTGLGHYLESLNKIAKEPGFDLALGGHEGPIRDVYGRIELLHASHDRKLGAVLEHVGSADGPTTVRELTAKMYPKVEGFNLLLALEEVGAHVEYLYQRGDLAVANLDEVESQDNPALRYAPV